MLQLICSRAADCGYIYIGYHCPHIRPHMIHTDGVDDCNNHIPCGVFEDAYCKVYEGEDDE